MEKLSNSSVEIRVAEHGAELQSIVKDGREYLWQGDPKFWGRRSPVLFPIVGRVYDDVYRYKGSEFSLGQHGFARDMDFVLEEKGENFLKYSLEYSDESLKLYPCKFRLEIEYRLDGNSVIVVWHVKNLGDGLMHFQIGAHPAFNLKDLDLDSNERGYFAFDKNENPEYIIPAGKGCISKDKYKLELDNEGFMPIYTNSFDIDTYTFENSQLKSVSLCDKHKKPYVTLDFDTPLVALWSPMLKHPDCPFVCIEPWYGRCDEYGYKGDFSEKEWMESLEGGATFTGSYRITVF